MNASNAPQQHTGRDRAVEGLRGIAALVVFYHHLMVGRVGTWSPPKWMTWPVEASAAVLVFFALSGYVIGLTNKGEATVLSVRRYIWRRMIRLIPVNTFAVLLACAAATCWDLQGFITNLLFMENTVEYGNVWLPAIYTNVNLWSLNYEVVYYAVFIAIWTLRPRLVLVSVVAGFVLLVGWYTRYLPLFLACYAAGYLFWLSGLALAWHGQPSSEENASWPSYLMLALVTWKIQPLAQIVAILPTPGFAGPAVRLGDIAFLPIAVVLLAAVARRTHPMIRGARLTALILPAVGIGMNAFTPGRVGTHEFWVAVVTYVSALALLRFRAPVRLFRTVAPLGAISFALYATARPIEEYIFRHDNWFAHSTSGFAVAATTVVVVSFALAWFLDVRMQPAIQRALVGKPAESPPKNVGFCSWQMKLSGLRRQTEGAHVRVRCAERDGQCREGAAPRFTAEGQIRSRVAEAGALGYALDKVGNRTCRTFAASAVTQSFRHLA